MDKIKTIVKNNSDKRLHKKRPRQRKARNLKDTNWVNLKNKTRKKNKWNSVLAEANNSSDYNNMVIGFLLRLRLFQVFVVVWSWVYQLVVLGELIIDNTS